jgi:hypothetical protein
MHHVMGAGVMSLTSKNNFSRISLPVGGRDGR